MKRIEAVIFNGKCYNFALGFVNERQIKHGYFDPDESKKLSSRLAKVIRKTVKDFLAGQPKKRS